MDAGSSPATAPSVIQEPGVDVSGPGILTSDLLSGDGPHIGPAEDFVHLTCANCRSAGELFQASGGYVCARCLSRFWWQGLTSQT